MTGIRFGTLVMVLAEVNRATAEYRARLERVLFFCFMFLLGMTVGIMQEDTFRMFMHGAKFYLVVMLVMPIWFAAASRASQNRWAATIVTGAYTAMHLAFMWTLQLIPRRAQARPRLPKNHASRPARFPAPDDRPRDCFRHRPPPHHHAESLDAIRHPRRGHPRQLRRGSVALREFPHVAGVAQLVLRHE